MMETLKQRKPDQNVGSGGAALLKGGMPPSGDFHQARKTWSRIKHGILGSYLPLLLGKLGRPGEHVFYVDGFAGQGRYENGEDGSPLIAAKLAANPVQTSRRDVLRCINVEEKLDTYANLLEATKPYVEKGIVTNLLGTFEDHLPAILELAKSYPTFFFIDPFGTESAEISTLQIIASRRGKTEVLVRYDDTRVKRLIAWGRNNWTCLEERHRKTAEAFLQRVGKLTSDAAIEAFLNDDPAAREALITGYISEVKRKKVFRFGIHYPVRNPATGGHHYYLAHFCDHEDGYCYMANFMAEAERTLEGLSKRTGDLFGNQPVQLELLEIRQEFVAQAEDAAVKRIISALPEILRDYNLHGRRVENRKIFAAIVDCFGYSTTRKEWVRALRELQQAGKLTMEGTEDSSLTRIHTS
jgi:three-Cys-motif partner protein